MDIAQFEESVDVVNALENYASFIKTWAFERFIRLDHKIIGLFTGNQSMKTSSTAYGYVMRIFGTHKVPKRNVLYLECNERALLATMTADVPTYNAGLAKLLESHKSKDSGTWGPFDYPEDMVCPECGSKIIIHKRKSKIIRFASEKLPSEKENLEGDTSQSAEVNNTQYPEFKKWLPQFLIKKDISVRNTALTIKDPLSGMMIGGEQYVGSDILIEFVSYSQTVQAGAGVQRLSCWCDEEPPFDFFDEQFPRLLVEDGDIIVSVTPAQGMTWTYDDIFEKAELYVRTKPIIEYYKREEGLDVGHYEVTESDHDIAVIQAATDDNPTLAPDVIENSAKNTPDPDGTVVATRRFGIFKQATGRIFKDFRFKVHALNFDTYGITREGMQDWVKGRSMDFHPANPHAIVWLALSPTNEAFVYQEWNPSPGSWVTKRLCRRMAEMSGFEKYVCNLIDPLANILNTNTGATTVQEMNDAFHKLKMKGICSSSFWEPYATRGEVGRDAIKERLQNSLTCKTPFNNTVIEDGVEVNLPTIWIDRRLKGVCDSIRHWRLETWVSSKQLTIRDKKEKPAEKWSHYCTALEGIFKDQRFRPKRGRTRTRREYSRFKADRR